MKRIPMNLGWTRTLGSRWDHRPAVQVDLPDDYIHTMERGAENAGRGMVGFFPSENAEYTHPLTLPEDFRGTLLLYLDGAYEKAEVFLDYHLIQMHPYGYTGFFCDLTRWLGQGEQTLRITTASQQPASRWYTGGGLYRGVTLYEAGEVYIHPWDVFVTTRLEGNAAQVSVQAEVTNRADAQQGEMIFQILGADDDRLLAEETMPVQIQPGKTKAACKLLLPHVRPWSVDEPNLYRMKVIVRCGDQEDYHDMSFGVRQIEIDAEHGFRLNGQAMKLRGGCIHHDNGFLGSAAFPRSEERKIALLKQAGFNAIRTAHNPPSSALLDACDRLGMLVLDESFDCWRVGKTPMDYHREFEKWWEEDTASMVLRDRNHPSVFCYSIGNEINEFDGASDGVYWGRLQSELVRSLDPTRPVTSGINMACGRPAHYYDGMNYQQMAYDMGHADGVYDGEDRWGKATEANIANLDIAGYNYMYARYDADAKRYPGRVIMGTETMPFYTYENIMAVNSQPHVIGDFVWVALDFLGEAGMGGVTWGTKPPERMRFEGWPWLSSYQGDLDLTGWRKPVSYYRSVVWGVDRGIHLFTRHPSHTHEEFYGSGWHWEYVLPTWTYGEEWRGKDTAVVAYADCDAVEFWLNGRLAACVKPERCMARAILPYEPGMLEARAIRNRETLATDVVHTAGTPAAIRLTADKTILAGDGQDLSYIRAEVVDSQGNVCYDAAHEITVSVHGSGVLQGVGSGNPKTEENYGTGRRRVFEGSITAAVRAGIHSGRMTVTFVAHGLPAAQITIDCTD